MIVFSQDLNKIAFTPFQVPSRSAFQGLMPDPALYARSLRHLVGQKRIHQRMYDVFLSNVMTDMVKSRSVSCLDWQYMPGWSDSLFFFFQTLPCFTQLHLFYTENAFYDQCCDSVAEQAASFPNLGVAKHQESCATWYRQTLTTLRNDVVCFIYDPYTLRIFEPGSPLPISLKYALIFNDVLYINPLTLESHYIQGTPCHPVVELPSYLNLKFE